MKNEKIGAIVAFDQQELAGIVTERDVLVRVVGEARDRLERPISEVMTSEVGRRARPRCRAGTLHFAMNGD